MSGGDVAGDLTVYTVGEDQAHRARLMTVLAAVNAAEAMDFLDALGLVPNSCPLGHGQRKPWCPQCRKKWPEPKAQEEAVS